MEAPSLPQATVSPPNTHPTCDSPALASPKLPLLPGWSPDCPLPQGRVTACVLLPSLQAMHQLCGIAFCFRKELLAWGLP